MISARALFDGIKIHPLFICILRQSGKNRHGLVDDMSSYEVDGWLYLYYGDHGSDPLGVLTEVLANLHTPLRDRVTIVNAIIGHYKMAQSTDTDPDPNGTQPVMPIVQQASQCGTEAARRGSDVYSAQLEVDKDGKG